MPSSQKRKQKRADQQKKARDERRLALIHYPDAFSKKITLDAHINLLNNLRDDEADYHDLAYVEQSIQVYDKAIGLFFDHLLTAAERARHLQHVVVTGDKEAALEHITTQLKASIDHGQKIAGLAYIEAATCCLHQEYSKHANPLQMEKVPAGVTVLGYFEETQTAYEDLNTALLTHMELCKGMGDAYESQILDETLDDAGAEKLNEVAAALEGAWRCYAVQQVHATVKAQFEEFAKRFFEDGRAHVEAVRVLDELEEGFEEPWGWVDRSELWLREWIEEGEGESTDKGENNRDGEVEDWMTDEEGSAEEENTGGEEGLTEGA
ncbi:hypothetical protein PSPO01_04205 [Paraphaeosphaeria sporulosa]